MHRLHIHRSYPHIHKVGAMGRHPTGSPFISQKMLPNGEEASTMITALCANPCVDRTVAIERFAYGGMNRILEERLDGSGKGVNVALASVQLGMEAACVGLLAEERGALIEDRLVAGRCQAEFVPVPGAVRVNMKVLDRSTGTITEINEAGAPVPPEAVDAMVALAVRWAARSSHIVLTGSTPPGCPIDIYRRVTEEIKRAAPACRVVLDAEGARMTEGLKALPHIIKPNRYELELLCGRELPTIEDVHAEAQRLLTAGIALVAVSLGGDGAYVSDGKQAFFAPAMNVPVRSTVGAGDSLVAGLLLAQEAGANLADAFRSAVAAATSSVTTEGTSLIDRALYQQFLPQVELRQVGL